MLKIDEINKLSKFKEVFVAPAVQIFKIYKVKPKDNVLIWCDLGKNKNNISARLGKTFYNFFKGKKCNVSIVVGNYIAKPHLANEKINEAVFSLSKKDLFISMGSGQALYFHKNGKRVITRDLIEIQKFNMVATNGLISVKEKNISKFIKSYHPDFGFVKKIGEKLKKEFKNTKKVKITCPIGSNLELELVKKREVINNYGDIKRDTNFPVGEVYTAPLEGSANGILYIKSSKVLGETVLHKKTKKYIFKSGVLVDSSFKKLNNALVQLEEFNFKKKIKSPYKKVRNLAEFAIGTNKNAKFIGVMINDEKIFGTVHVGLGANKHFGGKIACFGHSDHVIEKPTIYFDNKKILENGKFLI